MLKKDLIIGGILGLMILTGVFLKSGLCTGAVLTGVTGGITGTAIEEVRFFLRSLLYQILRKPMQQKTAIPTPGIRQNSRWQVGLKDVQESGDFIGRDKIEIGEFHEHHEHHHHHHHHPPAATPEEEQSKEDS